MESKTVENFKTLLGLETEPVALRWTTEAPEDLPRLDEKARFCAKLSMAMRGRSFWAGLEEEDCMGGAKYCGLQDAREFEGGRRSGQFLVAWGVYKSVAATQRAWRKYEAIEPGLFSALSFAPLSAAAFEPDVIFVQASAKQGMELLHANAFDSGASALGGDAAPICSSMAALPYLSGQLTYGFGDVGSRGHMDIGAGEVMVSLPGGDLERLVSNLELMRSKHSFKLR